MMNKILVLTDFSENARNAIHYALQAFPPDTFSYILLHCYPRVITFGDNIISLSERMRDESYEALNQEEKLISEQAGREIVFEKKAYLGFLNEAVNAMAEMYTPDLIVMGTKGETGLPAALLGSNASSLIKATHIPLLIVPEGARFNGMKEIVLAADVQTILKPEHLEPLVDMADIFESSLTVINVVRDDKTAPQDAEVDVAGLRENFGSHPIRVEFVHDPKIEHGIAQYVHEHPCDLLVVIERSRTFIVDLFHRSVSRNLALHADIPLFVLHA